MMLEIVPKPGAATPLLLLDEPEPELAELDPLDPLEPVPVGAEVTVPVPSAPACAIREEHAPVGLTKDWVVAEPEKAQAAVFPDADCVL